MSTKEVGGLDLDQWLSDNAPPPPVGDNELTVQRAMEHPDWEGLSEPTVRNRLESLVKDGKLEKVERTGGSGKMYAYIPKTV